MRTEVILSLDIGGTNCRLGLIDEKYQIYGKKIYSTMELVKKGFTQELMKLLDIFMADQSEKYEIKAIAMGFPSTVDRSRRRILSTPNIPGLDNLDIVAMFEEHFHLPVYLERDVNILLNYDLIFFNLPKDALVIGIYFGTGVGNSIYINGQMLYGQNGVAGELGHVPQLHSHKACGCGNSGCIEAMSGGRYLQELCDTCFMDTDISEIYVRHGEAPQVQEQVEAMAAAVATEVNILDPDYIVLGGGVIHMEGFPLEQFEKYVRLHTRKPYPEQNLRFHYARADQENGIIGAGIFGWNKYSEGAD